MPGGGEDDRQGRVPDALGQSHIIRGGDGGLRRPWRNAQSSAGLCAAKARSCAMPFRPLETVAAMRVSPCKALWRLAWTGWLAGWMEPSKLTFFPAAKLLPLFKVNAKTSLLFSAQGGTHTRMCLLTCDWDGSACESVLTYRVERNLVYCVTKSCCCPPKSVVDITIMKRWPQMWPKF